MATVARHVALMLTRRCNMSCGHCSVASGPNVKSEPMDEEVMGYLREAAAAGVQSVQITGGEPMLREELVFKILRECRILGLSPVMTTNGFWGATLDDARRRLKALRGAGLTLLTVSYDRYHAAFQAEEAVCHIARAAEELNYFVNVTVTRVADDSDLPELLVSLEKFKSVRLRFYDVQPVGKARHLPIETLRSEVDGFCNACSAPAITDDRRITACNGPAYFEPLDSPLNVGSLANESMKTLLERHWEDPVVGTIRTFGPARLREELRKVPGFESFPFRDRYYGMCDLCRHVTSDPAAVAALRTKLSQPALQAERQAAWQIIDHGRHGGHLSRDYVNGIGACKVFLRAAWQREGRSSSEMEQVLGRADIDWSHLASYLGACGLARPVLPSVDDPQFRRWAPDFFVERIHRRAIQDGMRELVQREIISRIDRSLYEMGGTGVLLKGAARLVMPEDGPGFPARRATGDIDVFVAAGQAPRLRRELLASGFSGDAHALRTAPHHLAAISFQGIPVEIHERIMPAFWGLPEAEMLESAVTVEGRRSLRILDAEAFVLHAGVHVASHLFAYGLKTGWDLYWAVEKFPQLDWGRLAAWVRILGMPRSFWVPVKLLCRELDIPVPGDFLAHGPNDAWQGKLELIARHRLFQVLEGAFDMNPFVKNGMFLMFHDSWYGCLSYLLELVRGQSAEARRAARTNVASQGLAQLPRQFGEAFRHWRRYRSVLSRQTAHKL